MKKNRLRLKKINRFSFGFISMKLKKPNRTQIKKKNRAKLEKNQAKPSQIEKTKPNQFEPIYVLKKQTESKPVDLNRF